MLEVGWRFAVGLALDQADLEVVGLEVVGFEADFLDQTALDLGKVVGLLVAPDLRLAEPLYLVVVVHIVVVALGTAAAVVVGLDIAVVVAVDLDIAAAAEVDLDIAGAVAVDLDIVAAGAVDLGIAVAGLDTAAVAVDLVRDIAVAVVGIDLDAALGTVLDAAGTVVVLDNLVELAGTEVLVLVDIAQDVPVGGIVVARTVDGHTCAFHGWLDLSDAQRQGLDFH